MRELYADDLLAQDWFQRIMKSEGGINRREPASVGGKSCAGISQKTYNEWKIDHCQIADAPQDVEDLIGTAAGTTYEKQSPLDIPAECGVRLDVITAFYKDYLKNARLDILPDCLGYIHADFYVNSMYTANKVLQRMVGFTGKAVDGILGPASRARIAEMCEKLKADMAVDSMADDNLIMQYHDEKLKHYESLKFENPELYNENIRGWRKRSMHILSELEDYFYDENPTTSAMEETSDVDVSIFASPEAPPGEKDSFLEVSDNLRLAELQQFTKAELLSEMMRREREDNA